VLRPAGELITISSITPPPIFIPIITTIRIPGLETQNDP